VKERAPGAINGADRFRIERKQVGLDTGGIVRVGLGQPAPPAPNANYLMALGSNAIHYGFDAGVESGHVPTARQYPDPHQRNLMLCDAVFA
jgi:hypothetical protein